MNENDAKPKAITYPELEAVINKWLLVEDVGLLRIVLATVIANKLCGDPVWLFIVAAPGATKTEFIRALNKVEDIYPISDLTPQTFLSGEKGNKNASLLLRLPFGTIITYKDFTTVISMHYDKQQAIMSQLREIFDGSYRKEFGTGETKDWIGKIGFIAGVTPIIDRHQEIHSTLGERFIQYRPIQPDSVEVAKKAIRNSGNDEKMREEIQDAIANFLSSIQIPENKVETPEEIENRIAHLANFCAVARTGVPRDGSTREIDIVLETESPTRLAKQLVTLHKGLSLIGGVGSENDYELIKKVAIDSLPKKRSIVLKVLIENKDEYLNTRSIAAAINYPLNTTRKILEDLNALKLVSKRGKGQGSPDEWQVSRSTLFTLEEAALSDFRPNLARNEASGATLPDLSPISVDSGSHDQLIENS